MRFRLVFDGEEHDVSVHGDEVDLDGNVFKVEIEKGTEHSIVKVDGTEYLLRTAGKKVFVNDVPHSVEIRGEKRGTPFVSTPSTEPEGGLAKAKLPKDKGAVRPPMTGKVVSIEVSEGDEVDKGSLLVTLEAMKMQNEILSPKKGRIKKILVDVGSVVSSEDVMLVIE